MPPLSYFPVWFSDKSGKGHYSMSDLVTILCGLIFIVLYLRNLDEIGRFLFGERY